MLFSQYLNLTETERRWCDYYDTGKRRGVLPRWDGFSVRLEGGKLRDIGTFNAVRYSRVWGISFSGDVTALKVKVSVGGTGAELTQGFCHIPLLCGGSPHSTQLLHPVYYSGLYPSGALIADNAVPQASDTWIWTLDPNFIVPNVQGLTFTFELENPNAGIPENGFFACDVVVHHYQFPGYDGEEDE